MNVNEEVRVHSNVATCHGKPNSPLWDSFLTALFFQTLNRKCFYFLLQLFFVARSTSMIAPWWWHRKEAFLQASLHVYDLTMASFCMELFTEVVFWHNLAFSSYWFLILWNKTTLIIRYFVPMDVYRVKNLIRIKCVCASLSPYYQLTISCGWTAKNCPFRIWVIFYRGVLMPKLNVEAEQLIWRHHICTKRNCIKIWRHQIPDVGIALMLSWLQCVQWIGGQSKMDWDLSGNRRTLKSKVKSYKEQARTRATCREISERKEHTWWWLLCRNSPRWEFRPSHWQQEHSGLRPCPALTHTYTLVWQTETRVANTYKHTPMTNTQKHTK